MRRWMLKFRRRRTLERDLEAELAFHREMAAARGNAIPMGNTAVLREQARDLWRFTFVENLWRDLVYGARSLRRSPALVITALLSLGLGIGINTGIFSLALEFLLSEPSVADPASLVYVILGGNSHASLQALEFVEASGVFQDVAGANEETFINFDDGVDTRQVFCVQTTRNFFSSLGAPVAHGRGVRPLRRRTDGGDPESFLAHPAQWRRGHGGPTIRLDGRAYTVTGILPRGFSHAGGFGFSPDVYVPRYLEGTPMALYARLKPGMRIGQARAAVATLARRMDQAIPAVPLRGVTSGDRRGGIRSFPEPIPIADGGPVFPDSVAVVGLVLLVACLNVATLLLARGAARRPEMAIRLSLGAGRGRLFQQLLLESLLLAVAGATVGLVLERFLGAALAQLRIAAVPG